MTDREATGPGGDTSALKSKLTFETWPIGRCIDYARNPRKNDHAVDRVAAAIKEFGFRVPIVAKSDGLVVDGHLRLKAAKKLGLEEVPVVLADDLTDAQIKAFRLSVNKVAEFAEWDIDLLKIELAELGDLDFDLSLTGFGEDELEGLLVDIEPSTGPVVDVGEDIGRFPCVIGDVFRIGRHVVACGDCSDVSVIDAVLCGETPDVVMYDPPFEVEDAWGWLYPTPKAIVFCDYKTTPRAISAGVGFDVCYQFVWDGVTSWYTPNRPLARHKSAFVFSKDPLWRFDAAVYHDGKERTAKTVTNTRGESDYTPLPGGMVHLQTVFQMGNTRVDDGGHAHAKPHEWVRALMLGCGVSSGSVVLDQFAGSGSFTVAAPDGASVRSIELDPETCGRAIARISEATGCQPERI